MFRASRFIRQIQSARCTGAYVLRNCSQAEGVGYCSQNLFQRSADGTEKRLLDLFHPLPGVKLPPPLPDQTDAPSFKITTLANGLKIASHDCLGPAACVGIFVDSGSIYETEHSAGATNILEKMAFSSTKNRSNQRIMREVEAMGGNVTTSASREQMVYSYDTLKNHLPEAVELLIDCVRNPSFIPNEFHEQVAKLKTNARETLNDPQQFLMEALNLTGYSGPLANALIAPESALERLNCSVAEKFHHENYVAERIVLAASGVDHEYLLSIAEPLLYDLTADFQTEVPSSHYVGGDFRHKADSEKTHVALAFEVPGGWRNDENATTLTVLQTLLGGGGSFSTGGPGKGMHSRLYRRVLNKYQKVDSFLAFSSVYNNTGIFGIHLTTEPDFVEKAVKIAAEELLAILTPGMVSEIELHRAKNSTRSAILMNLESRAIITEDIGRQILTYGYWKPVEHFLRYIDEMTVADIISLARKMLSSPLTMASWGHVDSVPCYDSVSQYFTSSR